ncbi:TIGR01620 family protein [Seohaeicola sp. SP36]|jgi:putative membrane protein|uniref:YcjF family protein n=1 Tax=unclassified Seohaeicola TaxID=2641111 RepID=UPI00237B5111|nr:MULTISPECIES: TIGR01620 family protein [unclassified Seohaeicola]MDD9706796.1 TIGR01620 family protein [Seohaeicola sp. 4SK31]MDD9735032.1 TIGR01620 family protein [Seohaeicola sp. SP36]
MSDHPTAGKRGPVLIELEDRPAAGPDLAPPVPDADGAADLPQGRAMQRMAQLAARPPSRLARWFWGLALTLLGAVISVAAYDFVTDLITRAPVLGYAVTVVTAALLLVLLAIAFREAAAFARLGRIDKLNHAARIALAEEDLKAARDVVARLEVLYKGRAALDWGRARLAERAPEQFDASSLLGLAETELMAPLDAAARLEVEAAARQVATVTALVPIALADVVAAMTSNLRMIRRIAEIYGGRSGTLGSWRLTRAVLTHLVATGAVAIGDDMIGSLAGGGLLSKLSRRFGEGVVNGALTARVGIAAMEVCRPLPYIGLHRPSVTALVRRALTGLFGQGGENSAKD